MFIGTKNRIAPLMEVTCAVRDRALRRAPQAEWGLAHQGAKVMLTRDQGAGWLVRRAGPSLVGLGLPLGEPPLQELADTARARGLAPLLYKCDARTAQSARRQGWTVLRLGHEAIVDLHHWSVERPACRQLRRKLRSSEKAGLRVELALDPPISLMEALSRDWTLRSGRERGFSMGRFDAGLLSRQRVVLAWVGAELVGFASFHIHPDEWTLDLMRHRDGAPDGTMHRIVTLAAGLARAEGATRMSLAAIPCHAALPKWVRSRNAGAAGLGQFKRSFGPRLLPRYAAAPGRLELAVGLAAVAWAIHRPGPLEACDVRAQPADLPWGPSGPRHHFAFEQAPIPCDARAVHLPTLARPARVPAPRGSTHDRRPVPPARNP